MPYEIIDHTADTGIRVWHETREGLFAEAGLAMVALITDPGRIEPVGTRTVSVDGLDSTDLLINWLRELLLIWSADQELPASVQIIELTETRLRAEVGTQPFDPDTHVIDTDIKAVTYHDAQVAHTDGGWQATVIFDV